MHEIPRQVLKPLSGPFGIDLSITNEVVLVWISALITFVLLAFACRRRNPVAEGWLQNLFEGLVEMLEKQVIRETVGPEGRIWTPFILTLFFFILFSNMLGLVPVPSHFKPATSNINVTMALALTVFAVTIGISLRRHGLSGFMKKFIPENTPWWIMPLLIPIEILTWLAKPVSLAIRLCANMMAGHAVISLFMGMAVTAGIFLKPIPLAGGILMTAFELFICFIQAAIFTMLSGFYIGEALADPHAGPESPPLT